MSAVSAPSRSTPLQAHRLRDALARGRCATRLPLAVDDDDVGRGRGDQPRVAPAARPSRAPGRRGRRPARRPVGRIDADDAAATGLQHPQRAVAGGNHLRGHELLEAAPARSATTRGVLDARDAVERVEAALDPARRAASSRGRHAGARRSLDRGVRVGQDARPRAPGLRSTRSAPSTRSSTSADEGVPPRRSPGGRRRRAGSLRVGRAVGEARHAHAEREERGDEPHAGHARAADGVPAPAPTCAGCCAGTRAAAAARTRGVHDRA